MSGYYGAGRLDKAAQVLELQKTGDNTWEWVAVRDIRVSAEFKQKINIFSKLGVGARYVELVAWRRDISLHNAILLDGLHLFLTGVTDRNRNQIDIQAAIVAPVPCTSEGITFPGVLTEKYVGHSQEDPMSVNRYTLVMVTPKAITLRPGRLVEVLGAKWEILTPHELDEYKNEYEIGRRVDL